MWLIDYKSFFLPLDQLVFSADKTYEKEISDKTLEDIDLHKNITQQKHVNSLLDHENEHIEQDSNLVSGKITFHCICMK